jgi:hypothetical protein
MSNSVGACRFPEIDRDGHGFPTSMVEPGEYVPNHIPLRERVFYTTGAVALFAYGLHGLRVNDLILPLFGRRRGLRLIHLQGAPALIVWVAMFMVCLGLLSVVIDHYDRRNNQERYDEFLFLAIMAAIVIGFLGLLVNMVLAVATLFR